MVARSSGVTGNLLATGETPAQTNVSTEGEQHSHSVGSVPQLNDSPICDNVSCAPVETVGALVPTCRNGIA